MRNLWLFTSRSRCCLQHQFLTFGPQSTESLAELVIEVKAEVTIQVTDVDSVVSNFCLDSLGLCMSALAMIKTNIPSSIDLLYVEFCLILF